MRACRKIRYNPKPRALSTRMSAKQLREIIHNLPPVTLLTPATQARDGANHANR